MIEHCIFSGRLTDLPKEAILLLIWSSLQVGSSLRAEVTQKSGERTVKVFQSRSAEDKAAVPESRLISQALWAVISLTSIVIFVELILLFSEILG